jgi:hypothetical protein
LLAYYSLYRRRDIAFQTAPQQSDALNLELTAQVGAGFAALLLAWPAIVLWEFVVNNAVLGLRLQFLLIYALYIVAFAYLGSTGVIFARISWVQGISAEALPRQLRSQYQLLNAARSLIVALGTGSIAEWASTQLSQ